MVAAVNAGLVGGDVPGDQSYQSVVGTASGPELELELESYSDKYSSLLISKSESDDEVSCRPSSSGCMGGRGVGGRRRRRIGLAV